MKLDDRMKMYEKTFRYSAMKNMPLVVRVDGKAFHTYTKNRKKPFDITLMNSMVNSAYYVAKNMQGFKIGYVQSDEATFILTDYDTHETESWFQNRLDKINSISASLMTAMFNYLEFNPDINNPDDMAIFDSRAFSIPKEEITNCLLWRSKDWQRNSIMMYASSFFSHKELHKKNQSDVHEMLHKIGKNWTTDLSNIEKNGTFLIKTNNIILKNNILPTFESIDEQVEKVLKYKGIL